MNVRIYLFINPPITWSAFASKSVCTTVAWGTTRWGMKFVDEVRSTVFHRSSGSVRTCSCSGVHDHYWSISSCKLHHLPLKDEHLPTNLTSMYHIWMLAHTLLAFSFLQLPQNDTIPQGVLCRRNLYRWVFRNCSFYWLHLGSCNYHSVRLQS